MAKAKTTVYLDEDILRATRVAAARRGKRDSEVFEDALRAYLRLDVIDRIRSRSDLTEEEALQLAYSELRAMRAERDSV